MYTGCPGNRRQAEKVKSQYIFLKKVWILNKIGSIGRDPVTIQDYSYI